MWGPGNLHIGGGRNVHITSESKGGKEQTNVHRTLHHLANRRHDYGSTAAQGIGQRMSRTC